MTCEPHIAGWPKISVVIPSRDQAGFLARALDSLAAQEYPRLEVIVVDGLSRDGTVELLKRRSDVVSRWVSEPDEGQTHALNKGYDMATGDVFGWLNCDERYLSGALRRVGEAFAADPRVEMVFGHRTVADKAGRLLERSRAPAIHPGRYALYAGGLLFSDATFWRADLHRRTGRLDQANCPRYGMDYDWLGRLGIAARRWRRINACLSEFTQHEGRVSYNVPQMPEIALSIRRRLQAVAGVGPARVILLSPGYFLLSRYGRLGWRGLLRPPASRSLLRVAGLSK